MSVRHLLGIGIVATGLVVAAGVVDWRAFAQSKLVVWPADAIKWTDNPAVKGAKQAILWGDPAKGAYGALKQVPGGTVLASHTHKNDSRVIVVKGTLSFEAEGKTSTLTPGSYGNIPGGLPHAASCTGTTACEYFEEMSGAFDSAPAKK